MKQIKNRQHLSLCFYGSLLEGSFAFRVGVVGPDWAVFGPLAMKFLSLGKASKARFSAVIKPTRMNESRQNSFNAMTAALFLCWGTGGKVLCNVGVRGHVLTLLCDEGSPHSVARPDSSRMLGLFGKTEDDQPLVPRSEVQKLRKKQRPRGELSGDKSYRAAIAETYSKLMSHSWRYRRVALKNASAAILIAEQFPSNSLRFSEGGFLSSVRR